MMGVESTIPNDVGRGGGERQLERQFVVIESFGQCACW